MAGSGASARNCAWKACGVPTGSTGGVFSAMRHCWPSACVIASARLRTIAPASGAVGLPLPIDSRPTSGDSPSANSAAADSGAAAPEPMKRPVTQSPRAWARRKPACTAAGPPCCVSTIWPGRESGALPKAPRSAAKPSATSTRPPMIMPVRNARAVRDNPPAGAMACVEGSSMPMSPWGSGAADGGPENADPDPRTGSAGRNPLRSDTHAGEAFWHVHPAQGFPLAQVEVPQAPGRRGP